MKRFKKILFTLLTVMSISSMTSCGNKESNNTSPSVSNVDVTGISIRGTGYNEGETLMMQRGQRILLAGTISPSNASDKTIEWSTTNADISVTPNDNNTCYIEAFDLGQAIITAKAGQYEKNIDVECVASIDPTSIEMNETNIQIPASTQKKIEYTILPENATNKAISVIVNPLNNADSSMIKTRIENNELFVTVEQLAVIGEKYEVTIRSAAVLTVRKIFTVEVAPLEIESMKFKNENVTISLQDPMYRMLPTFEPLKTTYTEVDFSSSNEAICEIDETGKLIPHTIGTVTITATNKHNDSIKCSTEVTINNQSSEYVTRLIKRSDVEALNAVTYDIMDFETDKVAFTDWKKVLSEDSNSGSHISDAGWAIWMVGFDTYDDDQQANGGDANALTYCKINVPQSATRMQYVFRSHPLPDDYAKFRILSIDESNTISTELGWTTFHETVDMFVNIDVSKFQGKAITFVVEQDHIGTKQAGAYMGVSLMFRRCLFDTITDDRFNEDDDYNILLQGN